MIKAVLWDFDGVILDSMSLRARAFELTLKEYPKESVILLLKYHEKNGGLSRYHKFTFFFQEILKKPVDLDVIDNLLNHFSQLCVEMLTDKSLLIRETVDFISQKYQALEMYIVSGSDQAELRHCAQIQGLITILEGYAGSNWCGQGKLENGKLFVKNRNITESSLVFVSGGYGFLRVNKVTSKGFEVNSSDTSDRADINWLIIEKKISTDQFSHTYF